MRITKTQIVKICKKLKQDFISYSFLSRGAHNESFIIKTKQNKLVLRIENNLQYKNLKKEYDFLRRTNGRLGPKVFLFDGSKLIIPRDFIIEEFLIGRHPTKTTDDLIIAMAKWLNKLHKIKSNDIPAFAKPKSGDYYSLVKSFECQGLNLYKKFKKNLDRDLLSRLDKIYNETETIVKNNEKLFFKQKSFPLNHGDFYKDNIFYDQNEIKLIDWEFVKYDLKEWDLVSFIYFFRLDKKEIKLFLETYKYRESALSKKKLNLILLLHTLWMISWWVERLSLARKNKIDKNAHYSSKEENLREISKNLPTAEKLIRMFYDREN